MNNHPKANFERTCDKCKHFAPGRFMRCNAARNLITGAMLPVDVHAARSVRGHCGPAGKRWEGVEAAEPVPPMKHTGIRRNGATVAGLLALAILAAWTPPAAAEHAPTFRSRSDCWHDCYRPRRHYQPVRYRKHHRHHDNGCKMPLTREGDQYASVDGAKQEAVKAWQQAVRWQYGERYLDRKNASHVTYECGRSSVGSVVGQVFYRCSIKASPCRPNRSKDD